VVRDREELLAKARREAESLVERARAEQARLVAGEAVVQAANDEAERIVGEARDHAHQVRMEADDYVDGKLGQFEITIQRLQELLTQAHETLGAQVSKVQAGLGESLQQTQGVLSRVAEQVGRGRDKLAGTGHPAQELAPEEGSFLEAEEELEG